jgi:hypothetical protein
VRTTLTLDDDVVQRLKAEMRRSGRSFKEVVNEQLRTALSSRDAGRKRQPPFRVCPRDLGALRPGLTLDNVAELLEAGEGPAHP